MNQSNNLPPDDTDDVGDITNPGMVVESSTPTDPPPADEDMADFVPDGDGSFHIEDEGVVWKSNEDVDPADHEDDPGLVVPSPRNVEGDWDHPDDHGGDWDADAPKEPEPVITYGATANIVGFLISPWWLLTIFWGQFTSSLSLAVDDPKDRDKAIRLGRVTMIGSAGFFMFVFYGVTAYTLLSVFGLNATVKPEVGFGMMFGALLAAALVRVCEPLIALASQVVVRVLAFIKRVTSVARKDIDCKAFEIREICEQPARAFSMSSTMGLLAFAASLYGVYLLLFTPFSWLSVLIAATYLLLRPFGARVGRLLSFLPAVVWYQDNKICQVRLFTAARLAKLKTRRATPVAEVSPPSPEPYW